MYIVRLILLALFLSNISFAQTAVIGSVTGESGSGSTPGAVDISSDTNLGTTNAGGICKVTGDNINCKATMQFEPCAFTNPVTSHSGYCGWATGSNAITITRVWCFTKTATSTATIQLDERTEAGVGSAGTDVMTAQLVCDTNSEATTSFTNAGIAANSFINLDIDAVANVPSGLMVFIEYAFQ